jgi:hypothetical protein
MSDVDLAGLETAIARRAADFDLPALLALLDVRFPGRRLRFESQSSRALEPSLIHAIVFRPDAVVIQLNLGLFSSTTPLPAYLDTLRDHPRAGPALDELLSTLDHALLAGRAFSMSPLPGEGRDGASSVRASALDLARPGSLIGLAWLFERVFPELSVTVRRGRFLRPLPSPTAVLGEATLGQTALGGKATIPSAVVEIDLNTNETTTWAGEPWSREASRRLSQYVFPTVFSAAVSVRVLLIDHASSNRLVLHEQGELGFVSLERAEFAVRATLFEGAVR